MQFFSFGIGGIVFACNKAIEKIMALLIPHDKDPPWVNSKTKKIIHQQNNLYKNYCKNNDSNKAHGHVEISIRMLKICAYRPICLLLVYW